LPKWPAESAVSCVGGGTAGSTKTFRRGARVQVKRREHARKRTRTRLGLAAFFYAGFRHLTPISICFRAHLIEAEFRVCMYEFTLIWNITSTPHKSSSKREKSNGFSYEYYLLKISFLSIFLLTSYSDALTTNSLWGTPRKFFYHSNFLGAVKVRAGLTKVQTHDKSKKERKDFFNW